MRFSVGIPSSSSSVLFVFYFIFSMILLASINDSCSRTYFERGVCQTELECIASFITKPSFSFFFFLFSFFFFLFSFFFFFFFFFFFSFHRLEYRIKSSLHGAMERYSVTVRKDKLQLFSEGTYPAITGFTRYKINSTSC